MEHPPNIYSLFEGTVPVVIQSLGAAVLVVLLLALWVRRSLNKGDAVIPDGRISVASFIELLFEGIANMARDVMGPKWTKFMPLVGTLGFFILVANLMGLVPGVGGATADANTTWAWATISWLFYTAVGIAKHKGTYIVKFMGPSFFEREMFGRKVHFRLLIPIFLPLEILLDLARILTLAVRLLANMFADHTVIAVWLSLVPIAVPAIFMGLGLIIAFLQAFVFALLTMIYIGLALEEPH